MKKGVRSLADNDMYGICCEWDYEKNIGTPSDYPSGTSKSVWWKCKNDPTHEWKSNINNRNNKNRYRGCPYCACKRVSDKNSLVKNDKNNLSKDWNYLKHPEGPEKYSIKSNAIIEWICYKNKGHIWSATIAQRHDAPNCPFCVGQKVCLENSLFSNDNHGICDEWHEKNEKTPKDYTSKSGQRVWWRCKIDPTHEWKASICDRNRKINATNCPLCCLSKGEILVKNWLIKNNFIFESEKTFNNLCFKRPLRFDFYIEKLSLAIEFDGVQHFDKNTFFSSIMPYDKRKMLDLMKTQYCYDNNINLIRISYKEINNIDILLSQFCNEIEPISTKLLFSNEKLYEEHIQLFD